ncbi:TonB family protein [Thermomonas sp.]|uniref:energy transducer TonB n=1 Tax=Thermomonas sp. TaxID=1971895 RepID=UPI00391D1C1F
MTHHNHRPRKGWAPVALTVAMACALAACKKEDATAAGTQGPQQAAPAPTPESVVAASVSAMSPDQLRDAANSAYNDNRLYAPAGNNAMEYFLALRDKQPGDAGASTALSDLLPMTVIATEQAISREDLEEAKRLVALIGKADRNHPALGRLKASVASIEAKLKQQAQTQQLSAEEEAKRREELAKKREEDQKKLQEQQRQQQAATDTQTQSEAERQRQAAAEAERQRQAAAAAEEQQRQQQAAAAAQQAPAPAPAPERPRPAPSVELRAISQPEPRFPPAAQRAGAKGSVQVEFTVGTDGSVTSARVVSSDASPQFKRDFEREALAAVKRWRFQPVSQATTSRRTIVFQ